MVRPGNRPRLVAAAPVGGGGPARRRCPTGSGVTARRRRTGRPTTHHPPHRASPARRPASTVLVRRPRRFLSTTTVAGHAARHPRGRRRNEVSTPAGRRHHRHHSRECAGRARQDAPLATRQHRRLRHQPDPADRRGNQFAVTTTEARVPFTVGHRTVTRVAGPLIIVDGMDGVGYGELVEVETGEGPVREGQVLELDGSLAVVQVFGGTAGIGRRETSVLTRGRAARTGVGTDYFGRVLDGLGRPRDGGPEPVPEAYRHVNGLPLNPIARAHPDQFLETGVSAIDGLITLVRGQKLPIFSGSGLPANALAARIAAQTRAPGDD